MGNLNITLEGYVQKVIEYMVKKGYAKSKTEAIRLALFEFDQEHKVTEDEEKQIKDISLNATVLSMKDYFDDPKEDKAWEKYF